MNQETKRDRIDLTLFGGAEGAAVIAADSAMPDSRQGPASRAGIRRGGTNAAAENADPQAANRAEFERLIKGDYREAFAERTQKIIDDRFKGNKTLQARMDALSPVLQKLAGRYGVADDDPASLLKALEADAGFSADNGDGHVNSARSATENVDPAKAVNATGMQDGRDEAARRIESQQARQAAEAMRHRQEAAGHAYREWIRQGEALRGMYPQFNLKREATHPTTGAQFLSLLKSHVPVRTAYEVIHKDEILGGAMRYTAQQVRQKTVEDIRARGMRPEENGAGGQGAAQVKTDIRSLSRQQRAEIARRVARGERITF